MLYRSTFSLAKDKTICEEQFLFHSIQVTGSTYCEIVFQTLYTSKILYNLEKDRKNSTRIAV